VAQEVDRHAGQAQHPTARYGEAEEAAGANRLARAQPILATRQFQERRAAPAADVAARLEAIQGRVDLLRRDPPPDVGGDVSLDLETVTVRTEAHKRGKDLQLERASKALAAGGGGGYLHG
jgi:hypothetical protein